jgi:spermidine/putrescine transport system permease protein
MRIDRRLESLLLSPLALLLLGAIVIPAVILLAYSLFIWALLSPVSGPTPDNFTGALVDPLTWRLVSNTILIGLPTTVLSVVGGYALAYYIVFGTGRGRNLLFALVVTALMASYLVRIFAWRTLLGESGVINSGLIATGLISEPLDFILFSKPSAIVAEVSLFMPLAALTFYSALTGISPDFREVARDLGAGRAEALRRVTIPLTGAAILATAALIFFLSAGDYVTPVLVGGVDTATVGTVIATKMGPAGNYGAGAALSFIVLIGFVMAYVGLRQSMRGTQLLPERTN